MKKETQALNDTLEQMDLIDIYMVFYPKTIDFTLFSNAHGTFSRIDHIMDHKPSLESESVSCSVMSTSL